jgi:hypothetical protein
MESTGLHRPGTLFREYRSLVSRVKLRMMVDAIYESFIVHKHERRQHCQIASKVIDF